MRSAGLAASATLLLTLALMPGVLTVLRRLRAFDHPNNRSSHSNPTLRGGGFGPWTAALVVLLAAPSLGTPVTAGLVVAALAFGLLGLVEDLRGISTGYRFGLQLLAAAGIAAMLDLFDGAAPWWPALAVLAVLWITAYVNAFNFMDGINGISGVQALVAGGSVALMALRIDEGTLAIQAAVIAAAGLGFLPFNFPRARVFLGDGGSYFFGGSLAVLLLLGLQAGLPPEAVLAPVLIYLADTGVTLIKRILRGEQWHSAHREHTYQRLTKLGWSHARVTLVVATLLATQTALGYATIGASTTAKGAAIIAMGALTVGYLLAPKAVARRYTPEVSA